MAKRKRVDSGENEEPVSKPAASTDSETSDSDDEVLHSLRIFTVAMHSTRTHADTVNHRLEN